MRLDIRQALRPVLCLPNPNALQGVRWERLDKYCMWDAAMPLSLGSQGMKWIGGMVIISNRFLYEPDEASTKCLPMLIP